MRSRKTRPVPWSTSYFTRLPRGISMTASYAPIVVLLRRLWIAATSLVAARRGYGGRVEERRPGLDPAVAEVRLAVRRALADLEPGGTVLVALSGGADSLALAAA